MKRLGSLILCLYPATWKRRYRAELEALIEDSGLRGFVVIDLLKEAIRMQLTTWPFGKMAGAFGLAGLLLAAVASALLPPAYVSKAEMEIVPAANQPSNEQVTNISGVEMEPPDNVPRQA